MERPGFQRDGVRSRPDLELSVLGPTEVRRHGAVVPMRRRERDVLATLALHRDDDVSGTTLVATLWPEQQPKTARQAVQNHISRIRTVLGDASILTAPSGYRLAPSWQVDDDVFDELVAGARRASREADAGLARALLRRALSLPRGDVYADLPDNDRILAARARRREAHLGAEDEHLLALLDLGDVGHIADAVAEASALARREPLREQRWTILALALYRHGSRRESLQALHQGRAELLALAGLRDGGTNLARLERLILDDDPVLLLAPPAALVGLRPGAAGIRDDAHVFVGRRAELDAVRSLLTRSAEERVGGWVCVTGEEGSGKTDFARRVAARAELSGWIVAEVSCHAVVSRPLEPLGDVLEQFARAAASAPDASGPALLADLRPRWSEGAPGPTPLGEVVIEAIERTTARAPTLVVLDDAHHLSHSVALLLRRAAHSAGPFVVMELRRDAPVRAPETDDAAAVDALLEVEMRGLDIGETTVLLEQLADVSIPADAVRVVHAVSRGNPLLVRYLASNGTGTASVPQRSVAQIAHDIVASTLASTSERFQRIVAVLAVAAGSLDLDVLAFASGIDRSELVDVIDGVRIRGVLGRDSAGGVALESDALRLVALDSIDASARADLHERLGRALVDLRGNVLAAAPHVLAVADRDADAAMAIAERAGIVAHESTMYAEAAGFFAAAATIACRVRGEADPTHLALLLQRAESLRRQGDPGHVDLAWTVARIAERVGDARTFALAAVALCKLGPLIDAGGFDHDVAEVVERAIAGCDDPALRALVAGQATLFYSLSGRVDRCLQHFHDSLAHARLTGDDHVILEALSNVFVSLIHPDDWPLRRELAAEMLALAERLGDDDMRFQAMHLYFTVQMQFCDPLIRTAIQRQTDLAATLRQPARRWMVGYQRVGLLCMEGRLDEADALNDAILVDAPVTRSRSTLVHSFNRVLVRLAQGRAQEVRGDLDAIIATQPGLPGFRALAAWIAALRGDTDRVVAECEALRDGADLTQDVLWSACVMLLGRAVAAIGDLPRCERLRDLLAPYSGLMTFMGSGSGGPFDVALAELAIALGDLDAADVHLALATRCVRRLGARAYESDLERIAADLRRRRGGSD